LPRSCAIARPTSSLIAIWPALCDLAQEEVTMAAKKKARKYGKRAATKVARAMHERKEGTLRSGRSGKKVTSRKQAIAIGLSEARKEGDKVPSRKSPRRKKSA
jgi:hypothetical protein